MKTDEKIIIFKNIAGIRILEIKSERGVSVYLSMMIMIIVLAIALGISTIIVSQMVMIREMGNSVVALYAADTGIERALYDLYKQGIVFPFSYPGYVDLNKNNIQDSGEPTYNVEGENSSTDLNCSADNYCITSVGTYNTNTTRAIEADG